MTKLENVGCTKKDIEFNYRVREFVDGLTKEEKKVCLEKLAGWVAEHEVSSTLVGSIIRTLASTPQNNTVVYYAKLDQYLDVLEVQTKTAFKVDTV